MWRLRNLWTDFWFRYHPDPNPVFGGRNRGYHTFREGRFAIVLVIVVIVIILSKF